MSKTYRESVLRCVIHNVRPGSDWNAVLDEIRCVRVDVGKQHGLSYDHVVRETPTWVADDIMAYVRAGWREYHPSGESMIEVKTTTTNEIIVPKVGSPAFEEIILAGLRALLQRDGTDIPRGAKVDARVFIDQVRDGGGVRETTTPRAACSIKVSW